MLGLSVSLFTLDTASLLPHNTNLVQELAARWRQYQEPPPRAPPPRPAHAHSHEELEQEAGPEQELVFHAANQSVHRDEDTVAKQLAEKVKVLCWVMTQPRNHKSKVSTESTLYDERECQSL